ncbi:xylulokinase [soil metagenome]
MNVLIGIDIGTQGTKAVACGEDGAVLAEAFEPSRPRRPGPGMLEEDPEIQLDSACRTVRSCVEQAGAAGEVAGLAIAGQMAGVVGVGEDGRPVTPYDSWLDTRCAPFIGMVEREAGEEVLEKTGCAPSFNHGPKILWWKHERPDAFAKVAKWVQPGGYVAMRLCGLGAADAFIDDTYLHFSGFADNRARRWDAGLCAAFGIDPATLPRIVAPGDRAGFLTPEMAGACGLPSGLPVVAGCGDTAASFLSCGASAAGICVDVAGTASVFAATTGAFAADHGSRILGCGRSVVPGLWHPYAYINGGGMNLEWFRQELAGGATLDDLNALAEAVPLADDLPMFVPHLGGRVSPCWPDLRGSGAGLTWDHGPAALYRAALAAVALEYALYRRALEASLPGATFDEIRVPGGGEKSAPWNQIKADALQTPIVRIERGGGAPVGAALLAGAGVGLFDDIASAATCWVRTGAGPTDPDPARAGYYRRRTSRYASLLGHLNRWASEPTIP